MQLTSIPEVPFIGFDPQIVAEIWIYLIVTFVFAFVVGIIVTCLFFKRSKDLLNEKKELFENEKQAFEKERLSLTILQTELDASKEEVALLTTRLRAYDYFKTAQDDAATSANDALYDYIHS